MRCLLFLLRRLQGERLCVSRTSMQRRPSKNSAPLLPPPLQLWTHACQFQHRASPLQTAGRHDNSSFCLLQHCRISVCYLAAATALMARVTQAALAAAMLLSYDRWACIAGCRASTVPDDFAEPNLKLLAFLRPAGRYRHKQPNQHLQTSLTPLSSESDFTMEFAEYFC